MSLLTSPYHHHHSPGMPLSRIFSRRRRTGEQITDLSQPPRSNHGAMQPNTTFPKRPHLTASNDAELPPYDQMPSAEQSRNPFVNRSPATRRPPPPTAVPAEPPPAYTPPIAETSDDPYAFLTKFDTVFLIDDSGSMAGRSWKETAAAITAIAPICAARDKDGIDVHFLNHPRSFKNLTSTDAVENAFRTVRPSGGTPTGTRLHSLLKPYLEAVKRQSVAASRALSQGGVVPEEVKPLNIIVITDGVPSDDVESVIMSAARKLEAYDAPAWQVGIQFFQVGCEPGAAEALRELDDDLIGENCPRDIVDTVPWNGSISGPDAGLSGDKILKCVLGAVVKKLDRRRNSSESHRGGVTGPNRTLSSELES